LDPKLLDSHTLEKDMTFQPGHFASLPTLENVRRPSNLKVLGSECTFSADTLVMSEFNVKSAVSMWYISVKYLVLNANEENFFSSKRNVPNSQFNNLET
jgi:hypothetical protein